MEGTSQSIALTHACLALGNKLVEIRQRTVASGRHLADWEDLDRELAEDRDRQAKQEEH